ncbi:MAG: iron ABC transporter permease [SAR324 cluster bacterium]|nr:iron ABC transporter permease [SAR324 cluster bacterium]
MSSTSLSLSLRIQRGEATPYLFRKALLLWLFIGWFGALVLPWYQAYDGFWNFIWIEDGWPLDGEYAPGILQIFMQDRLWLLPLLISIGLPIICLSWRRDNPRLAPFLMGCGGFGLGWLLLQGFVIGLRGWNNETLQLWLGSPGPSQEGMGYGALLVASCLLFLLTQGWSLRGGVQGDGFVTGSIGLNVLLVLLFIFYPVTKILLSAFLNEEGTLAPALFLKKLTSSKIWQLSCLDTGLSCGVAWNSLYLAILVGLTTTLLGLAFALLVTRTSIRGKKILQAITLLPIITPPFVIGLGIILLFGRSGVFSSFLEWAFEIPPSRWIYGLPGIWFAQTMAFTPIAFLVLIAVVEGVSPSMEEAAQTLRANRWKTFQTVTWPLMRPGLANAFLLGFIESLADFGNPLVLGGNFEVLSTQIFFAIAGAQADQGMAAVLALVLLGFTLTAFWIQRRWLGKRSYVSVTGKGDAGIPVKLPQRVRTAITLVCVPFGVLTLTLYGMILFGGFVDTWGYKHNFTLKHYFDAFALGWSDEFGLMWEGTAWNSFWTTLQISAISAPLTAGLGLLTAWLLVRQRFAGKDVFEFITMLSFAIPGTVIGIGYILAFNIPPIEITGTGVILIVCFLFRNMPTGIRAGVAAMAQLDPSLDEASLTLGAPSSTTLRKILLPLLRPALLAALVFSFVRAMTAISAVIFLVSADYDMATSYILGRVENADYGLAIAYSSVLIVVMLIAIGGIQWVVGQRQLGRRGSSPISWSDNG